MAFSLLGVLVTDMMSNSLKNKRILIVDDLDENLELMRVLLQSSGYQMILEASNGRQAVEIAHKESPELIIMDINMPVMTGIEALRTLRLEQATARIPVVAFTAYTFGNDRETLLKEGFDGFIAKPIKIDDFVRQVNEFLPVLPDINTI